MADQVQAEIDRLTRRIRYLRARRKETTPRCLQCRGKLDARAGAKYCSDRCRQAAYQERSAVEVKPKKARPKKAKAKKDVTE